MAVSRRSLLISGAAAGAAGAVSTWPLAASAAPYRGPLRADPFTLGVASGDPEPDGFVIWTRLAPTPPAEDGLGGMPSRDVPVHSAVVFDDHEVENNWADEVPEPPDPNFPARRAAAFRAYYENMPLRRRSIPRGIDMQLYRRLHWGRLATFHMLDTRQFRDDQGCGDGYKDCPAALDPARSITGPEQEKWLLDGFRTSTARWDVLGQQVFFGRRDNDSGSAKVVSMDSWDGYAASRDRITRGWVDDGVRNPVVLTGDVHAHWADDLKLDYDDPASRTVGTELVCSSITSTGDGAEVVPATHPWTA